MSRHAWLWTVLGVVAAVAILIVGSLSGHIRRDDPDAVNCAEVKCVALTFDDGPGPYTDRLLKILQDTDSKATFFLIGNKVAANPRRRQAHRRGGYGDRQSHVGTPPI